MANLQSSLVLELLDRVTSPARKVANSLAGISNTVREMGDGQRISFGDRLDAAITRNNRALEAARGNLVDAAAGFYALKGAIAAPVQAAMDFEDAMADVRKVVDFPTPEGFRQFQADLFALSRDVPVAVDGLAQIAAAAGAAGIAGDELVRFTEAASKVGVAFEISAEDAGVAMSKMMTGLGLTLDETVRLADAMNHLSDAQASNASEVLDVVRRVGAQGKMFGFTAEQTAAFGSAMIAAGAQSDVAATSFNNMGKALTRGAAATKGQREAYAALGMDAEKVARQMQEDAVGTTVSVLEAISRLPQEQQAAVASQLFGDEARALGPLLTNLDLVRSSLGLVGDEAEYAGSAFREFENRNRTFSSALQRLRNRISELSITIGSALLPALDKMVAFIGPLVTKIADLAAAYPEMTAAIVGATGAVVAFRVAIAGLSYLGLLGRGGALSMLSLGFNTIGRAAGGAYRAASASIALQTALGAMSGEKIGLFGKLGAGLRGLAAVTGLTAVKGAIAGVAGVIGTISAPLWLGIAAAVGAVGLAWKYWDRISSFVSGVGQALGEILSPALEAIRPALEWFAPLGEAIAAGWEKAKAAVSAVGEWLGSIFGRETLSEEDKAAAKQSGFDFVMSLWDGMKQVATDLLAWVRGIADDILAPFKALGATIRSYLPGGGGGAAGFSEDFGVDGQRAKGGAISRGGTYLVGEKGPELITPSRSGYVNPAGSFGGGGGGVTVNNSLTMNISGRDDAQAIADKVSRAIEERVRAAFRGVQADTGLMVY